LARARCESGWANVRRSVEPPHHLLIPPRVLYTRLDEDATTRKSRTLDGSLS
jgi:hypothetical protein